MDDALDRLASLLWTERNVLRRLQFHLATHQLVVSAGEWEWLVFVEEDVRATTVRLRHVEVLRAAQTDRVLQHLALAPDTTLARLARCVPEPWPAILADHDEALRALTVAIDEAVERSEVLARDAIAGVPPGHGGDVASDSPDGPP